MSNRRWLWWVAAGLVVIIVGVIAARSTADESTTQYPLSSHSSRPDGALALYMWSQRLGKTTRYLEYEPFELSTSDAVLVSLKPADNFTQKQIAMVRNWVGNGGTFLIAGGFGKADDALLRSFGARRSDTQEFRASVPAQPLLTSPPVRSVLAPTSHYYDFSAGVPLLVSQRSPGQATMFSLRYGSGRVFALAAPDILSNKWLGKADNAKVYLNLISDARSGTIVFDEYHHGRPAVESLHTLVLTRPWGWSLIGATILLVLYLLFSGRRLGRPIRTSRVVFRNSGDYINGISAMIRSKKDASFVSNHYASSIERTIRKVSGLPPGVDLREAARIAREHTGEPAEQLVEAVYMLHNTRGKERYVLKLVKSVEPLRRRLSRRRPW